MQVWFTPPEPGEAWQVREGEAVRLIGFSCKMGSYIALDRLTPTCLMSYPFRKKNYLLSGPILELSDTS